MHETAWLVERQEGNLCLWLQWSHGSLHWTNDSLQALRFARQTDADGLAEIFGSVAVEHMWGD